MNGDIGPYQLILIIVLIFTTGIATGQLVFQVRQSGRLSDKLSALAAEVNESRRENGVIIGCLYMLAAAIGDPKIKEIIESMLERQSRAK